MNPADNWLLQATIDSGVLGPPQNEKALFKRYLNCVDAALMGGWKPQAAT
jgi:hypothetical protein